MSQPKPVAPPPSLNVQDILYVLFKHKWKILVSAAIGIGAAAAVFSSRTLPFTNPRPNCLCATSWTQALSIKSIPGDSRPLSENLINSEVEILTSWDLAMQVAKAVGVERLLPESEGAAGHIQSGPHIFVRD